MSVRIRAAETSDAAAMADLVTQLGYPSTPADMPARLARLLSDPDAAIWVAERDGEVAGLATAHAIASIHKSEPVAMLTVLVVSERHRGLGIGKALLGVAEQWAAGRGATVISLTSALRRVEAHEFYKANGYDHTGVRLAKPLAE